jgi:membrane-associated phospholipid phosphatase
MRTWFRKQLSRGIFGGGWRNAAALLVLTAAVAIMWLIYGLLNHGPSAVFLKTSLDAVIPLVPAFVIPYLSLQPLVFVSLVLLLLFRSKIFESAAQSMIAAWLVSFAFFILMQSWMDRPVLTGNDVCTRLLRDVYANDAPYNCFPSLHVSLSTILAIHWLRVDKRIGVPFAAWTVLIVLSTVFVKQHYIADVLGGLALAFGTSLLFLKAMEKREIREKNRAGRR